jgi:hypothetical protein
MLLSLTMETNEGRELHDHTYGITSDPLTQFAVVFAALIHDVDHTVPNSTLINEKAALPVQQQECCWQNSVDIAWAILMDPEYDELRATSTLTRPISSISASWLSIRSWPPTSWTRPILAVPVGQSLSDAGEVIRSITEVDATNRKATIVIEHLIQASDVSHTMQHQQSSWNGTFPQVYRTYKGAALIRIRPSSGTKARSDS